MNSLVSIINELAGENLTAGNAVYLNLSDNKIYKSDTGNATDRKFTGFALSTVSNGNPVNVQCGGTYSGLSSLTSGLVYYIGSAGAVSTTQNEVMVGIATSTIAILIMQIIPKKTYWYQFKTIRANYTTSKESSQSEQSTTSTSYVDYTNGAPLTFNSTNFASLLEYHTYGVKYAADLRGSGSSVNLYSYLSNTTTGARDSSELHIIGVTYQYTETPIYNLFYGDILQPKYHPNAGTGYMRQWKVTPSYDYGYYIINSSVPYPLLAGLSITAIICTSISDSVIITGGTSAGTYTANANNPAIQLIPLDYPILDATSVTWSAGSPIIVFSER